jgi:hypothetical protein
MIYQQKRNLYYNGRVEHLFIEWYRVVPDALLVFTRPFY